MDLTRFQEQIFFSTVRIISTKQGQNESSVGTGFICGIQFKENVAGLFLVSNRHVFESPQNRLTLTLHSKKSDGNDLNLTETVSINADNFTNVYTEHPNSEVDLACINISQTLLNANAFFRNVHKEMFCDFTEPDLYPGAEVWFVGYPDNRFDGVHNLPILRRGYIASMPTVDYDGKPQFVIDAQVFPGSSGSPVFAAVGNEYKFLGVVAQTMIKYGRLQTVPTVLDESRGVQQTLGLGLVIKAPLVRELLDVASQPILQTI